MEEYKNKLSFVAIVKNEAPYIIEWIEFHKLVGVDKFYIYDNESSDNLKELLQPYIKSGIVVYHSSPGKRMQNVVYTDAIRRYQNESKYMGFIDIDEFVVPNEDNSLYDIVDDILTKKEHAAGVAINWRIYGSNGHIKKPDGLVIENYKYRAKNKFNANKHIKTICNPRKVVEFKLPHYPVYNKDYHNIDEDGNIVNGPFNPEGKCKRIRINHYFTKSKIEYVLKASRGKANSRSLRGISEFIEHDKNDLYDDIMNKYIPTIKKNEEQIMTNLDKASFQQNYTEYINSKSLPDLIDRLEKRRKKAIYQSVKNRLAKMYDSLSYEIEKKGKGRK